MTTDNYPSGSEPQRGRKTSIILIILISVLFCVAAYLAYVYYTESQELQADRDFISMQKDSLEVELNHLFIEYDSLKTNNDSINNLLTQEQDKILRLLKMQASDRYKIKLYEKELQTLRKIMRSYIVQIDSLNTLNQELTAQNIEVRSELDRTKKQYKELHQEKEQLSSKVEIASALSASDINIYPKKNRNSIKYKSKKVNYIEVNFIIRENPIVSPGPREIFIRILRPDGVLMTPSANNIFTFKGEQLLFSAKREVVYENADLEVSIFYDKTEEFVPGTYTVDIYADDNIIGSGELTLE